MLQSALGAADATAGTNAKLDGPWRSTYLDAFRAATVLGADDRETALRVARAGLAAVDELMVCDDGNGDTPVSALLERAPREELRTMTVLGDQQAERELTIPYRGSRLAGDALRRQLDDWVTRGVLTSGAREQVTAVLNNPSWLSLEGRTVVALGAAAEMAPVRPLLRWGATVAAVDVPRAEPWARLQTAAAGGAGTLLAPQQGPSEHPGVDLLTQLPETAEWLVGLGTSLVLGTYLYADSGAHVRLSVAADVLGRRVRAVRPDAVLAYLATPTDTFIVPSEAVEHCRRRLTDRGPVRRASSSVLRRASRSLLLEPAYTGDGPHLCDALVPVQGPNYALAKRIQRWRAAAARDEGATVSLRVAPASATRSVMKNRVLRAVYAGAHRFGVEVFAPDTANTLLAALLVHDLHVPSPVHEQVWQDEAYGAVHGGLWTAAYEPRSALGLAALLGAVPSSLPGRGEA